MMLKNMRLPFLGIGVFFVITLAMLSLLKSGVALAMVQVETRTQPSNWAQHEASQPSSSVDQQQKMEFLQQEMQELRGKVEEQTYQLQQLQDQQKKLYLDLDRRLRDGREPSPAKTSAASSSGITFDVQEEAPAHIEPAISSSPQASLSPLAPSSSMLSGVSTSGSASESEIAAEKKAYQNAYQLIQNRDYDKALLAFKSLAKTFPEGKYLPNAHYWLGEIYLVKGQLDLAAESFNSVYKHFPHHPKAADSLLKLGYVEYSKGQWRQSQAFLTQVKNQFPGSTSAQLADSRLQRMQQEGRL